MAQACRPGDRSDALVLIEEAADGGRGIGGNVLTLTMRNEHDRAGGHRGESGSYGALSYGAPGAHLRPAARKRRPNGTRSWLPPEPARPAARLDPAARGFADLSMG